MINIFHCELKLLSCALTKRQVFDLRDALTNGSKRKLGFNLPFEKSLIFLQDSKLAYRSATSLIEV